MLQYFMKRLYYTRIIHVVTLLLFTISPAYAIPGKPFLVTEVIDGDTVSIKVRSFIGIPLKMEQVKLIGIDAPDLKQEPWGRLTKKHLKKLINDSSWVVNVELDMEQRDRHGRLLAYLWTKNGRLINEMMLEDGFVFLHALPPNVKHLEQLASAQKMAQLHKRGVWGKDGLKKSPSEWRREHPKYQE